MKVLEQIDQLNRQIGQLFKQGQYARAIGLATQACDLARNLFGAAHPNYAATLNNVGTMYYSSGNNAAAEPFYRQALEIRRKALGEQNPDFAQSLYNLALLYKSMGNSAAAEPLFRQALEIRRRVFGEEHPDFALSLISVASLYSSRLGLTTPRPSRSIGKGWRFSAGYWERLIRYLLRA
jgi:tetratricopeptide (TPR) repeat protein